MALVLDGLCKRFDNSEKDTLHEIDLEVKTGEFVCIVGASGCGKSTLLNLVAGLERPSQGKVLLDGEEVIKPGADRTVMFQEHGLFPWLSVLENVKFGMRMAGFSKEEQDKITVIIRFIKFPVGCASVPHWHVLSPWSRRFF